MSIIASGGSRPIHQNQHPDSPIPPPSFNLPKPESSGLSSSPLLTPSTSRGGFLVFWFFCGFFFGFLLFFFFFVCCWCLLCSFFFFLFFWFFFFLVFFCGLFFFGFFFFVCFGVRIILRLISGSDPHFSTLFRLLSVSPCALSPPLGLRRRR